MTRAELAEFADTSWTGPQLCFQCGRPLNRDRAYLSDDIGIVVAQLADGGRVGASVPHDLAFCTRTCAASWLESALREHVQRCDDEWMERAA